MNKYFTADSYKNWERVGKPFTNSKGKLYTKVKCKCDRCVNGVYVSRIENGAPVPHPNANGVCFQCGGDGYLMEEVRLYTEKEYAAMQKRNEQAREKKEQERETQIINTMRRQFQRGKLVKTQIGISQMRKHKWPRNIKESPMSFVGKETQECILPHSSQLAQLRCLSTPTVWQGCGTTWKGTVRNSC